MVKQYPHYLFAITGAASAQDANGNWSEGTPAMTFVSMCREEKDGRGTEIQVADGTFHKVTSLIQLPFGSTPVAIGTNVIVANDESGQDVRISGIVLNYDPGQLHSRLWV